ncbi:MAG TPA: c-type cytochrome [Paenalcaligenes sp.]|nr:c-type cytochrome [Paenalcaligenes sp.]
MSMTDNQPKPEINDDQLGTVKHPLRIFLTAIFAFLIPIGALILILEYATNELRQGGTARKLDHEAVIERIQPVARLAFEVIEEEGELKTGEEVYNMTCATCHADGVAGAPKFGDEGEWAPYIETGYETLLEVALHGKGAMPAKGGNTSLDDLEVERAMVYMANAAGANYAEPGEDGADETQAAADKPESTEVAAVAEQADGDEFAATEEQLKIGEALYKASCFACHDAAVAGAPKFGSAEAWQPYIDTGLDAMLQVAIEGKGAMPPRGASSASDDELKAAILYMVAETK